MPLLVDAVRDPAGPTGLLRELAGRLLGSTPLRFLLVGVWNFASSVAFFAWLYHMPFGRRHYMLVLAVTSVVGVTNSFVCHRLFTFRSKAPLLAAYLRFYIVYGVQIGLTFVLMPLCVEVLRLNAVLAQVLIAAGTTILTYFGHKSFSFQARSGAPTAAHQKAS
jgi:putative flippase GtrA